MNTCMDCGKPVSRTSRQCASCYRTNRNHDTRQWACTDCGVAVERKVKRCPACARAALYERPVYERTPEHRGTMSKALAGKPKPGARGKGTRPHVAVKIAAAWTDEMKEAARERGKRNAQDREWMLKIARSVSGENNPMWQGGIANSRYAPGFCKSLKAKIRARDNYTCQLCGRDENELGYRLSIHHSDYDKTNHATINLFATCKRCNSLVNARRAIWTAWFRDLAISRQLT